MDRASNDKFSVELWIFVIFMFFNWGPVLNTSGCLISKEIILSELDCYQIWFQCHLKRNQNKHSKFNIKFVFWRLVKRTWSAHNNKIRINLVFEKKIWILVKFVLDWYFVTKIVLTYCEKKIFQSFWNSRLKDENFKIFEITRIIYSNSERSEQFLVTECFLTSSSWRFLISYK